MKYWQFACSEPQWGLCMILLRILKCQGTFEALCSPIPFPSKSKIFSSSQCFGKFENHPILSCCGVRAMPLGTICQLNYYGGGRLQDQDSCGKLLHLPFENAPYLRVSQQVSFSINHILGWSEASNVVPVNLAQAEVTKSALETEGSESFTCAAIRGESQGRAVGDLPASGSMQLASNSDSGGAEAKEDRPGRKLQRSIGEYHNADMQERLQLITRAEERLEQLLAAAEIDGDALGRLVCRCVGWLHAPLFSENGHAVDTEAEPSLDASSSSENSNLQLRLRRLLIRALSHLDLTDDVTRAAVETALMYIQGLITAVPRWSDASTKRVTKQWQALQSLVATSHRPPATHSQVAKPEKRRGARKDWATTAGGTFQPGQKILNLPSVSMRNHGIRLTCSHCGHEICSKWFWRHPATGIVHVLAPFNGHSVCSRKLGKKVRWIVDGDIAAKKTITSLNWTYVPTTERRDGARVAVVIASVCTADGQTCVRFAENAILCAAFCCEERKVPFKISDGQAMEFWLAVCFGIWCSDALHKYHVFKYFSTVAWNSEHNNTTNNKFPSIWILQFKSNHRSVPWQKYRTCFSSQEEYIQQFQVALSCPLVWGPKGKRRPSVHFAGQDRVYDGIRYLQQPMGYPSDGHREEKPLRLWPQKFENEANFLERTRSAVHIRRQPFFSHSIFNSTKRKIAQAHSPKLVWPVGPQHPGLASASLPDFLGHWPRAWCFVGCLLRWCPGYACLLVLWRPAADQTRLRGPFTRICEAEARTGRIGVPPKVLVDTYQVLGVWSLRHAGRC